MSDDPIISKMVSVSHLIGGASSLTITSNDNRRFTFLFGPNQVELVARAMQHVLETAVLPDEQREEILGKSMFINIGTDDGDKVGG